MEERPIVHMAWRYERGIYQAVCTAFLEDVLSAHVPKTFHRGRGHRDQVQWRLFASICTYEILDPVTDPSLKPPVVS